MSGAGGQVMVGAPVVTMDGEQLGSVKEVRGRYFKVDVPMAPDYWLALDNISSGSGGQVVVAFAKDRLGDYQLGEPDEVDTDTARMTEYRATDYQATAPSTANAEQAATHQHQHAQTEQERTVRLHEERLQAQKQAVETGEVGIRKEVVAEQQTIDVPVTREEVVIERRPASGRATGEEIGEGEEIRIPVREEQVTVQKTPVATEEVSVGKRAVQDTQRVTETVRREEARLETEGDVELRNAGETVRRDTTPRQ